MSLNQQHQSTESGYMLSYMLLYAERLNRLHSILQIKFTEENPAD